MKRIIASLAVFASMSFAGSLPAWASSSQECSNATLQGTYGFERQGFNPAIGHVAGIGIVIFDGNGHFSGHQTNLSEARGVSRDTFTTGIYQVDPDCTGSTADTAGPTTIDFVIVSGGNELLMVTTTADPPGAQRVVTWVFKKLD